MDDVAGRALFPDPGSQFAGIFRKFRILLRIAAITEIGLAVILQEGEIEAALVDGVIGDRQAEVLAEPLEP